MPRLYIALLFMLSGAHAGALEVALVGDNIKDVAFQQVVAELDATIAQTATVQRAQTADRRITLTLAKAGRDPVAVANQLLTADLALLVIDATDGALPISREHLLVARQAGIPHVSVYFARTSQMRAGVGKDANELLELLTLEMRELLAVYKMGGDETEMLFDADVRDLDRSGFSDGTPGLLRFLSASKWVRPRQVSLQPVHEFQGVFYLLTELEGRERNRAVTLTKGSKLDVWVAGSFQPAVVQSDTKSSPGDAPDITLRMQSPANGAEGLRVLLLRNGMVVGLGVIAKILN